jgi:hypothetical protein
MEQTMTTERKFDVSTEGQARLTLANISGSVDVQPGDDGAIVVIAEKDNRSGDAERTHVEMEQAADGSVTVKTDYGESFWRWIGQRPCDVDYTVRVPRNCQLNLKCISSKASVKGLAGQFNLSTVSGELRVAELSGSLKVDLVSGNLSAERLSGPVDVETVSGRVELRASQLPSLRANTVSGRVNVETPLSDGPYRFHSVSGDVRLSVPADTRCSIDSNSLSGRLDTNLPVTFNNKSGQHWRMEVQGGGSEVRFDSISGTLHVTANNAPTTAPVFAPTLSVSEGSVAEGRAVGVSSGASAATATPNAPPPPPASTPEDRAAAARRDILDRVARGELSVEDAINKLRG